MSVSPSPWPRSDKLPVFIPDLAERCNAVTRFCLDAAKPFDATRSQTLVRGQSSAEERDTNRLKINANPDANLRANPVSTYTNPRR